MIGFQNLEIHVTHSCNLACESCSHYSNQGHKGNLDPQTADQWMKLWNKRIAPRCFSLLGGEPTINPQFTDIVRLACDNWPNATIRLVTNGFFLDRHPQLPLLMKKEPRIQLEVSNHHPSPEYQAKFREILQGLQQWTRDHGIKCHLLPAHGRWTRRYKGFGAAMEPFDDKNPLSSWHHCMARTSRQLHEGKLWKCAPITYLKLQDEKYHLSERWKPYLEYRGLDASCSDSELLEFIKRQAESCCGMCPANPERFELPNPMRGAVQVTVDSHSPQVPVDGR